MIPTYNFLDQIASISTVVYDNPNLISKDGAFTGLNLAKKISDQYTTIIDDAEFKGRDSIPIVTLNQCMDVVGKAGA